MLAIKPVDGHGEFFSPIWLLNSALILTVTSVVWVRVKEYQSLSRYWCINHTEPQTVSPQAMVSNPGTGI